MPTMSEQMATILRETINASKISANQLAALTGVKQQTISTFLRGEGISLATAQKIADYFGLALTPTTEPKASAKKK